MKMPGEIRTVCKVSFDVPAKEQPYLHASQLLRIGSLSCHEVTDRIGIESMAPGQYVTAASPMLICKLTMPQSPPQLPSDMARR